MKNPNVYIKQEYFPNETTEFKIGDKVETKNSINESIIGTIISIKEDPKGLKYIIARGGWRLSRLKEQIKLIHPIKFKIGDTVQTPLGEKGTITDFGNGTTKVKTVTSENYFNTENLILIQERGISNIQVKWSCPSLTEETKEKGRKMKKEEKFEECVIEVVAATACKENTTLKVDTESNELRLKVPPYPEDNTEPYIIKINKRYDVFKTTIEFNNGLITIKVPVKEGTVKQIL